MSDTVSTSISSRNHANIQRYNNKDNNRRKYNSQQKHDGPKREAILDLSKYRDQQIRVKFIGGRQITGTLKGYDQLMNLVLEDVVEQLVSPDDEDVLTDQTRPLGLVVVRCTNLLTISPVAGSEVIENPFVEQ